MPHLITAQQAYNIIMSIITTNPNAVTPDDDTLFTQHSTHKHSLIIGCGALAKEILFLINQHGCQAVDLMCIPAKYHNQPQFLPALIEQKIVDNIAVYHHIYLAFADCGTGGLLDKLLKKYPNISRITGPHCYSFFAGHDSFDDLMEQEIGSFFLTDYLVRHFDSLIIKGMGLDKNPMMRDLYFSNYTRLVYLAQIDDDMLDIKAKEAADYLQLSYVKRHTGYGLLNDFVGNIAQRHADDSDDTDSTHNNTPSP